MIYMYTYIYIYIHIHMHTYVRPKLSWYPSQLFQSSSRCFLFVTTSGSTIATTTMGLQQARERPHQQLSRF